MGQDPETRLRFHEATALAAPMPVQDLPLPLTSAAPPPKPEAPAPQPPGTSPSQTSRWAALLARIYEIFPLICPSCHTPLTFIAFLTDPEPIAQILVHIGEPTSPPLIHPARGPPHTDLAMDLSGGEQEEATQESFPDDLDQSPDFDPADPEPVPEDHFHQTWGA